MTDNAQKLAALRSALQKEGVGGFIIPRTDEYQGEYVPPSAERLRWLTGFTGSAGTAIVLKDRAVVMSDGRYTIQLRQQVDANLFGLADSTEISPAQWMATHAAAMTIGYDPRLHTPREVKAWADKGISVKPLAENPVDSVWADRPAPPAARVESFPISYAGVSAEQKLDGIAADIAAAGVEAALITLPDSIAWLLNVRAHDIAHIPVPLSYAIARADGTLDWFIDPARVEEDIRDSFEGRVALHAPGALAAALDALSGKRVLVDGRRTSVWFTERLKNAGAEIVDAKDPCIARKARKNKAEQAAMRSAHIRDGAAMVKFLRWLEKEGPRGRITELDVEAKLESFRREAPSFRDTSFDTIAGFGPNGAIVHYRASAETNLTLETWNLLLLDSGAQYADGTTDITRTIAIGQPTQQMKEHYTLVLKAHIAVASARFPAGTTGAQIDALARAPLWQHNLDYAHGTGHGVGCYLSVHEEAASLSPRGHDSVEAGMIVSNEPGYYREGAYGIRIENLVLCREDGTAAPNGKPMLSFETLTLVPFDKTLILTDMLTGDEKFWLATYHKRVLAELSPHLDADTKAWLVNAL